MIDNLKIFQKKLKQINILLKEKQINNIILEEFKTIMEDLNNDLNVSNIKLEKLEKEKHRLNRLESKKEMYKVKGYIYTFIPVIFALLFSPIIYNIINLFTATLILSLLSVILSTVASIYGFEEYNYIKKELNKLPKINIDLQNEYKNNDNLKYDLSFYNYKQIEIKKEQESISINIKNILIECVKEKDKKQVFVENDVYSKLISNKIKIKK